MTATYPFFRLSHVLLGAALVTGCAVGPDYKVPTAPVPAAFKEAAGWKPAAPNDGADRGSWWDVLHDPILDMLERQAAVANQSLLQAAANYEQARQLARADRATLFPTASANAAAQRAQSSRSDRAVTSTGSPPVTISSGATNTLSASLDASWTPDFWGRVRRLTETDIAVAQASAADLASARLSIQSTLAQNYIQLRIADERIRLRENAAEAYRRTLTITQNKYHAGISARNDVSAAMAQLDAARAQVIDAAVQRAQFEHAIAVLMGKPPSDFTLEPQPSLQFTIPDIPVQLPSELLERRPDIAAAQRNVAAANARVGVQVSAWFPQITLSATGGYRGSALDQLFTTPARFWSLGATLGETLLDFGRRRAEVAAARAAYDASVAGYRQTVLTAFQAVEDNLSNLRLLESEAKVQDSAVAESTEAARIALNEYNAGIVDYTTVATAQVAELNNRQAALAILQSRMSATVALIEALGGGWRTHDLPSPDQVLAPGPSP